MRRKIAPMLLFVFFILSISTLPLTQSYATAYSASLGDINENSRTDTGGGKAPEASTIVQGITFVSIPGGTFQMGSTTGLSYEQLVHSVTVSGFQMSRCEITQAQYQAVMGNNPAKFPGDNNRPVEQVSWFDAVTFCNKLSELSGLKPCYNLTTWECDFTRNGYRLPTEAEWEYACRAGTATKYYTGENENDLARAGWYFVNSGSTTHAVGGKEPNAFGLYDMHGNVWEWCNDWYGKYSATSQTDPTGAVTGANRISRGGGWQDQANDCRLTLRYDINPGDKNYYIGFRVVGHESGRTTQPIQKSSLIGFELSPAIVSIPGGTFQMGSTTGLSYEQPVHSVTVSGFQISRCEITQAQYLAVMGNNPAKFPGDNNRPVEQVSWFDAVTFCNKLSELAGLKPCYNLTTWECDFTRNGYRLPTEAEWEYACRAGTATKYYTGDSENDLARAGWYFVNSGSTTHAVGGKEPNAFGLYDMHGNVWEWCNDWYGKYSATSQTDPTGAVTGANRISRGGGWQDQANDCRLTLRYDINPGDKNYYIGFRVVRR